MAGLGRRPAGGGIRGLQTDADLQSGCLLERGVMEWGGLSRALKKNNNHRSGEAIRKPPKYLAGLLKWAAVHTCS